jgi:predicted metal-dependent enzyme (double-stranded beta helix superfamily)
MTGLDELLDRLRDETGLWAEHVRHDPDRRVFVEIAGDADFEAWLICWMPGHDTGFHDHDLSCGAVSVLSGELLEERLILDGPPVARRYRAGESFAFDASDIHRCRHAGEMPTTTLHVYAPRLRRMGAYSFGAGGVLARRPLAHGEELRPLTSQASPAGP